MKKYERALFRCVICDNEFKGYGNNAQPVKEGLCCDNCNFKVVLPARVKNIFNKEIERGKNENNQKD